MRWLVGQAVKTLASHAENMGSIPVRVTKTKGHPLRVSFLFCCDSVGIEPSTNASRVCVLWVRNIAPSSPLESLQDGANSRTKSRRLDAREIFYHQKKRSRTVVLLFLFLLATRMRNLTRRQTSLGSHTPRRVRSEAARECKKTTECCFPSSVTEPQ